MPGVPASRSSAASRPTRPRTASTSGANSSSPSPIATASTNGAIGSGFSVGAMPPATTSGDPGARSAARSGRPASAQHAQQLLVVVLAADREGEQVGLARVEAGVEHLERRAPVVEEDALGDDAGKRGEAVENGLETERRHPRPVVPGVGQGDPDVAAVARRQPAALAPGTRRRNFDVSRGYCAAATHAKGTEGSIDDAATGDACIRKTGTESTARVDRERADCVLARQRRRARAEAGSCPPHKRRETGNAARGATSASPATRASQPAAAGTSGCRGPRCRVRCRARSPCRRLSSGSGCA